MANGIYDFILAHHNPNAANSSSVALEACIHDIFFTGQSGNGYAFDGNGTKLANTPLRAVPGIDSGNALIGTARKIGGNINDNFQGNITTSMARYLKEKFNFVEFKNTNIYGNYNQWGGENVNSWNNAVNTSMPDLTNVGLVGNYDNVNGIIRSNIKGVLDIKGPIANAGVINVGSKGGYLNLIGDVGNGNIGYRNLSVIDVTGVTANIDNVGKVNSSGDNADVIIFASKSQADSISGSSGNSNSDAVPTYRAFEKTGTRKYAPSTFSTNYKSPTAPSGNLPNLSEQAWEAAEGTPTTISASGNVWNNTSELAALSPLRSIYLAGGLPAWTRTAVPIDVLMGRKKEWGPEPDMIKPRNGYKFVVQAAKGRERMG
jgi:hypothetical protein